jgi:hypothetical protein
MEPGTPREEVKTMLKEILEEEKNKPLHINDLNRSIHALKLAVRSLDQVKLFVESQQCRNMVLDLEKIRNILSIDPIIKNPPSGDKNDDSDTTT